MNIWVFAGNTYYASGGLQNLRGRFPDEMAATFGLQRLIEQHPDTEWYQIVDVLNARLLRHYGGGGYGSEYDNAAGKYMWPPTFHISPEDTGKLILIHGNRA
jgi:hypothetical protein